ncbi:MAG: mechanosensitive ion channel protein MscS [Robiginitomaculum sp.]|nr:MAG: mechanosensitive ion channel protein MscS [Robiginitomaculum sp.]
MDVATLTSSFTNTAMNIGLSIGPKILLALMVFVVGKILSARIAKGIETGLNKAPASDASVSQFFASLVRYFILFATLIITLSILGINMGSLGGMVAGLGIAMAFILADSLSDLSAGVMLMLFRPFRVGDEVEIGGTSGVVTDIQLTAVRMKTRGNVELIVQNSKAWGGAIRNHSVLGNRRLSMAFGISYDANIDEAFAAILAVVSADSRVHKDPAPWIKVINLGGSSVDLELRIWCDYDDLRALKTDLSQPVKQALDAAGIGIPYPHVVKIRQKIKNSKARARITKLAKLNAKT